MAMMRYGRAASTTTQPDKVVKNKDGTTTTTSGKISVTMGDWVQPEKTPAPKGYISEDDYNAYEAKRKEVTANNEAKYKPYYDAVAAYQKEQDDYKTGMDIYNRQLETYKQGPSSQKADPNGIQLKGGKNVKGQDINFVDDNSYSAERSNKELNDLIKSGKVVDIYDKSINPNSRKVFLEQIGSGGGLKASNDIYGTTTGKTYVDRDEVNKIKSNIDVWGEDFNAVEFHEASRKGQLDKYLKSKGYNNRTHVPKVGFYQQYNEPVMPTKPTSQMPVKPVIKEDPLPEKPKGKIWPNKMPTREILGIKYEPSKMKYAEEVKDIKEGDWEEPTGGKFKRKGEIVKSREGGQDQKTSIFSKRIKTESSKGGYGIQRSPGNSESKGLRAREEKMAKAFYSPTSDWGRGGYYANLEGTEGEKNFSKTIRSDIKDIRAERREWKKQTSSKGADRRPALQGYREDIKTGRLAARYAKRGDLNMLGGEEWEEGSKSRLKIYTADKNRKGEAGAMSGYVKSAEKNIEAARLYQQNERSFNQNAFAAQNINKQPSKIESFVKTAEDNATNRNTIKAQMGKYKGWDRFVQ